MNSPVCCLDMDGVLVNFVEGAHKLHGVQTHWSDCDDWGMPQMERHGKPGASTPEFWQDMGRSFWAKLDWMPEGKRLLAEIEGIFGFENVLILSSPCDTDGCRDGKMDWVKTHMPAYKKKLALLSDKRLVAGPDKILVDDSDDNIRLWSGPAVLVPRPWNRRRTFSMRPGYLCGTFDVRTLLSEIWEERSRIMASAGSAL